MSHRHRLICLVAAVGLAVWFLVAGNGGVALAGVGLAMLVCPLVMGAVMWLVMRRSQPAPHRSESAADEQQAPAGPR